MEVKTDASGAQVTLFGSGDTSHLSNAYRSPIHYQGYRFRSVEQYYFTYMALHFKSYEVAKAILSASSRYSSIAANIVNLNRDQWNHQAEEVMYKGLREKFRQSYSSREQLLKTGNSIIIFSSNQDAFWGNGLSEEESIAVEVKLHPGKKTSLEDY